MDLPGATMALNVESWMAPLAVLARPEAREMLIVGLGSGRVLEAVPPAVQKIDVIELEPAVVDANRAVGAYRSRQPLLDARLRLIEGMNHVLRSAPADRAANLRTYATPDLPLLPVTTALHQNVPNPFNPQTVVAFDLARAGRARLLVYGVDGRLVRVLVDGELPAGRHAFRWDGTDDDGRRLSSGVYLTRLVTADGTQGGRMTMLK